MRATQTTEWRARTLDRRLGGQTGRVLSPMKRYAASNLDERGVARVDLDLASYAYVQRRGQRIADNLFRLDVIGDKALCLA